MNKLAEVKAILTSDFEVKHVNLDTVEIQGKIQLYSNYVCLRKSQRSRNRKMHPSIQANTVGRSCRGHFVEL